MWPAAGLRRLPAVLLLILGSCTSAQEMTGGGGQGVLPPTMTSSMSSVLGSLGSWFSGVSDRLYTTVTSNIGERISLSDITDRVSDLVPEYESAPSSVISTDQGGQFEIRYYPSRRWICTEEPVIVEPVEPQPVQWNRTKLMFDNIFRYFSGHNSRGEKLQLTLPMTNKFNAFSESPSYNMCFYIPDAFQRNPPRPLDPALSISAWPAKSFIVRRFEGLVLYRKGWDKAAFDLEKLISDQGLQGIDFSSYYSVYYDPPVKFWSRRNEVWFEITG